MLDSTAYLMTATHPRMVKHINQILGKDQLHLLRLEDYRDVQQGFMQPAVIELWKIAANELQFQHRMQTLDQQQRALTEQLQEVDVEALTEYEMTNLNGYQAIETKASTLRKMLNDDLRAELQVLKEQCDHNAEEVFNNYMQLHHNMIESLKAAVDAHFAEHHPNYKLTDEHYAPLHFVCLSQIKDLVETLHLLEKDLPVTYEMALKDPSKFAKLQVFLCVCNALNHIDVS